MRIGDVVEHDVEASAGRLQIQRFFQGDVVEGRAEGHDALMRAIRELREERPVLEAHGHGRFARAVEQLAQGRIAFAFVADVDALEFFFSGQSFLDRVDAVNDVVEVERLFAVRRTSRA